MLKSDQLHEVGQDAQRIRSTCRTSASRACCSRSPRRKTSQARRRRPESWASSLGGGTGKKKNGAPSEHQHHAAGRRGAGGADHLHDRDAHDHARRFWLQLAAQKTTRTSRRPSSDNKPLVHDGRQSRRDPHEHDRDLEATRSGSACRACWPPRTRRSSTSTLTNDATYAARDRSHGPEPRRRSEVDRDLDRDGDEVSVRVVNELVGVGRRASVCLVTFVTVAAAAKILLTPGRRRRLARSTLRRFRLLSGRKRRTRRRRST